MSSTQENFQCKSVYTADPERRCEQGGDKKKNKEKSNKVNIDQRPYNYNVLTWDSNYYDNTRSLHIQSEDAKKVYKSKCMREKQFDRGSKTICCSYIIKSNCIHSVKGI